MVRIEKLEMIVMVEVQERFFREAFGIFVLEKLWRSCPGEV